MSENDSLGRVILYMFEVIFQKISLQILILVCKSVPKSWFRKLELSFKQRQETGGAIAHPIFLETV